MRTGVLGFGWGLVVLICWSGWTAMADEVTPRGGSLDVVFGSPQDCDQRLIEEIAEAERSVHVRTHALPSPEVLGAIRRASARGVGAELVINAPAGGTGAPSGLDVFVDRLYPVPVGSVLVVIDRRTAIVGAMRNGAATDPREVAHLQVIRHVPALARQYYMQFRHHRETAVSVSEAKTPSQQRSPTTQPTAFESGITLGHTTRADAITNFGEPTSAFKAPDGTETWTYQIVADPGINHAEAISFTADGLAYNHTTTRTATDLLARAASSVQNSEARPAGPLPNDSPQPVATALPRASDNDAVSDTTTVYVTASGTKYHAAGCQHLRKSKQAIPLSEARERYEPCSRCNPPR